MSYRQIVLKFIEFNIYLDMYTYETEAENKKVIKEKYDELIKTILENFEEPLPQILANYLKMEREEIEEKYSDISANYFRYFNMQYFDKLIKGEISRYTSYKRFPFEHNLENLEKYTDEF